MIYSSFLSRLPTSSSRIFRNEGARSIDERALGVLFHESAREHGRGVGATRSRERFDP
jgi:hypothetical protein